MAYTDRVTDIMEQVFRTMPQLLDERQRRILAASMAKGYGHGGIKIVSGISGMDVRTIRSGIHEIEEGITQVSNNGKLRNCAQITFTVCAEYFFECEKKNAGDAGIAEAF